MFGRQKSAKIALERLQEDLDSLRVVVSELDSKCKKLELEWIETYDKVRHQLSRMAKRGTLPDAQGHQANGPETGSQEPEMDPISARIHARRNRGFLRPPNQEK